MIFVAEIGNSYALLHIFRCVSNSEGSFSESDYWPKILWRNLFSRINWVQVSIRTWLFIRWENEMVGKIAFLQVEICWTTSKSELLLESYITFSYFQIFLPPKQVLQVDKSIVSIAYADDFQEKLSQQQS